MAREERVVCFICWISLAKICAIYTPHRGYLCAECNKLDPKRVPNREDNSMYFGRDSIDLR